MTPDRWQQIERLYYSALELEESQRASYLRSACAGDESLVKEVESLLAQEKGAPGFLEAPAIEVAAKILNDDHDRSLLERQMGSYQILSLLGAGGMGAVYQAHDTKLGRSVAIKVLPSAFAQDPERLARFQREARMLASLNHPNIATIHGLEQSDGVHYLVMELVPGETLAERVNAGPLAVKEALKIANQIAEALEAAHEQGVIHRDLKPANVKVTPEGRVKVLDFGLAKAFAGDADVDVSQAPTLSQDGRILGTPAYMSPEQARGKRVDKRTDIWSFGCVLYELMTGKRAFRGATTQDTIAAVLEREPNWEVLPAVPPAQIRTLLIRCLQKDPQRRLHDIADARIEIEEVLATPPSREQSSSLNRVSRPKLQQAIIPWGVAAVLATVALFLTIALFRRAPAETRPIRFTIGPPEKGSFNPNPILLAISPDGSKLAFIAADASGKQQLWIRALDSPAAQPLPGTENADKPFWSADSRFVGFYAEGKLKKIAVTGGAVQMLVESPTSTGGTWSAEGIVLFTASLPRTIYRVSVAGGTATPVTTLDDSRQETFHGFPYFLPDGKHFLYFALSAKTENDAIYVGSLDSKDRKLILNANSNAVYASPGYILFSREGTLMAQPFDAERMQLTGEPVPIAEGVQFDARNGMAAFAASNNGVLAYRVGGGSPPSKLVWVNRNGVEQALAASPHSYSFPRLSPDGRRLAVDIVEQDEATHVWLYDLFRETLTPFTFEGTLNQPPAWTPDGKRIAFRSNKEGTRTNIFWQLADGSGGLERLRTSEFAAIPRSFSPDGQLLAFFEFNPATAQDIWVLRLNDRQARPFLQTKFNETDPAFSPDGHWLAYRSDKSGRPEIYVQPYPGPGGEWQISTAGGMEPVWNPNGRELFYRIGDKMMAVDITTQPGFSAGKPRIRFAGQYVPTPATTPNYDVSPDGQRFLMLKAIEQEQAATQINVVLNWFEELKRRVPAK
jgi:eukaryotic-like serine/threonine-protein kinase